MQQLISEKATLADKLDNVLNDQSLNNRLGDELEKTLVEGEQEREQLHEHLKKQEEEIAYLLEMPHLHVFAKRILLVQRRSSSHM